MGNEINVIDLYWLMEWENYCPEEQQIEIEPGFYSLTFCGEPPTRAAQKTLSEEEFEEYTDRPRIIDVYINRLEAMLDRECTGVPELYWAYED